MNQANLCTRAQRVSLRSLVIAFVACSATLVGHAAHAASALTISGSPASTVTVGSSYSFTPTTHDTNTGRTLSFAVANKPAWASFSSSTGQLSGTPTAASVGKYADVVIAVYDGLTSAILPNFGITVQASGSTSPPSPPGTGLKISGSPASTVTVGSSYSFTPTTTDSNSGRTLSFAVANKPAWASFSSSTGHLSGTPTAASVGKYADVVIAVYDGLTSAVLPNFDVTVQASASTSPPSPPGTGLKISGSPASTVTVGSSYSFTPTTTDSNSGRTLSFAVANKPAWASFSSSTGHLSGTPTAANVGKYADVVIAVYDGLTSAVLPNFGITVQASGSGTSSGSVKISGTPPASVTAGSSYHFQPSATDSAGRTVSFSVANKPSWATFSIASGLLSGTPTTSQTGTYANITISASDGQSSSALPAFSISVGTTQAATGSATLEWSDPTKNTNGSALTDLAGSPHLLWHLRVGDEP